MIIQSLENSLGQQNPRSKIQNFFFVTVLPNMIQPHPIPKRTPIIVIGVPKTENEKKNLITLHFLHSIVEIF